MENAENNLMTGVLFWDLSAAFANGPFTITWYGSITYVCFVSFMRFGSKSTDLSPTYLKATQPPSIDRQPQSNHTNT